MASSRFPVLVVTRDIALGLAIQQLRPEWRVDDALPLTAPDDHVLVVDLVTLDVAFEQVRASGVQPRLVICDDEVDGDVPCLRRPFPAEQLVTAIEAEPAEVPARFSEPEPEQIEEPVLGPEPEPGKEPVLGPEPEPGEEPVLDPGPERVAEPEEVLDLTALEPPSPARSRPRRSRRRAGRGWAGRQVGQLPPPSASDHQDPPLAAAATSARASSARGAADDDPVKTEPGSTSLEERLLSAVDDVQRLLDLIDEFPMLGDLASLRSAVVEEARSLVDADVVTLWQRTRHGFEVAAAVGATSTPGLQQAKADHPLLHEVATTRQGLLLAPVDAMRALVAGIAGTHTASLIAIRIGAAESADRVLVVGRDRYLMEDDLDRLVGFGQEAGPMLQISQRLTALTQVVRAPAERLFA